MLHPPTLSTEEFVNKLFADLSIKLIRIPVQNFYDLDDLKNKIKEILKYEKAPTY